jgi:hypothetical protein
LIPSSETEEAESAESDADEENDSEKEKPTPTEIETMSFGDLDFPESFQFVDSLEELKRQTALQNKYGVILIAFEDIPKGMMETYRVFYNDEFKDWFANQAIFLALPIKDHYELAQAEQKSRPEIGDIRAFHWNISYFFLNIQMFDAAGFPVFYSTLTNSDQNLITEFHSLINEGSLMDACRKRHVDDPSDLFSLYWVTLKMQLISQISQPSMFDSWWFDAYLHDMMQHVQFNWLKPGEQEVYLYLFGEYIFHMLHQPGNVYSNHLVQRVRETQALLRSLIRGAETSWNSLLQMGNHLGSLSYLSLLEMQIEGCAPLLDYYYELKQANRGKAAPTGYYPIVQSDGIRLVFIEEENPFKDIGMQEDDLLLSVNDTSVVGLDELEVEALLHGIPGDSLIIEYRRGDQIHQAPLLLTQEME